MQQFKLPYKIYQGASLSKQIMDFLSLSFILILKLLCYLRKFAFEILFLNCNENVAFENYCVGEDSWEPLGLQGDLTSSS